MVVDVVVPAHPGRLFAPKAEARLHGVLRQRMVELQWRSNLLLISSEFRSPRGVPDLTGLGVDSSLVARRVESGLSYLQSMPDCAIAAAASLERAITPKTLARRTGLSESQVVERVRRLANSGHLLETDGRYRRHPSLILSGHLLAMEAKVDDWRGAVAQTLRYSAWADRTAILMPHASSELLDATRPFGTGVATPERWVRRPRRHTSLAGLRLQAVERLVAAYSQ